MPKMDVDYAGRLDQDVGVAGEILLARTIINPTCIKARCYIFGPRNSSTLPRSVFAGPLMTRP
jgi:hypothetical protein